MDYFGDVEYYFWRGHRKSAEIVSSFLSRISTMAFLLDLEYIHLSYRYIHIMEDEEQSLRSDAPTEIWCWRQQITNNLQEEAQVLVMAVLFLRLVHSTRTVDFFSVSIWISVNF
jgi:hypothetical protein